MRFTLVLGALVVAWSCTRAVPTGGRPVVVAVPSASTPDAGAPPQVDAGPPEATVREVAPDNLPPPGELLGAKRLDFRRGDPLIPVRLMEGAQEVHFSSRGRLRMRLAGPVPKEVDAAPGSRWTVRARGGKPAATRAHVQLAELVFQDKAGLKAAQKEWEARGLKTRVHTLGALYGIAGKVIDNRRYLLLLDEALDGPAVAERQAELLRQHGTRTSLFEEVTAPASAILELFDGRGSSISLAEDVIEVEPLDGHAIDVRRVEYGVGYDFHNFEDRSYRGALEVAVDRHGALAAINVVSLEDLLKGLVPAEIFARAPAEALKAQAVTARGEVLAKIGLKHLADPYLLCSEQHCAVYRGLTGEAPTTNAAVEATRGEALFSRDGRLVDSVYSAVCGGHTEHNEIVWGTPPNASLRGRPDILPGRASKVSPSELSRFLSAEVPAACRLSSFAQPTKFRWEKRFTRDEVNALTASLGVGPVQALSVAERGVSGRARLLTVSGERGATQVRGELNIRRLFGMLNSAMFEVSAEKDAAGELVGWRFVGGGWGHGVGLCQTGAIGRAEAGQRYRQILQHYFNGAQVSRIY